MRAHCLSIALTLTACGGRSSLQTSIAAAESADAAGSGGGSASGATSGSGAATGTGGGSGGSGGQGGADNTCASFQVGLGPLELPWPDPAFSSAKPGLVGLGDDSLGLLVRLPPVESPGPALSGLGHVKLWPWVGSALIQADPKWIGTSGAGERAVTATTVEIGSYALGFDPHGDDQVRVIASMDPTLDYLPEPLGVDLPPSDLRVQSIADQDGRVFCASFSGKSGDVSFLELSLASEAVVSTTQALSGCGLGGESFARTAVVEGRVLVAANAGAQAGTCMLGPGPVGLPTRLQTGFVEGTTLFVQEDEVGAGEPIIFLEMVSAGDHAWVFWTTDGSTSFAPPPIFAARLDAFGAFTGERTTAIPAEEHEAVGVAAFREGFVTASIDRTDPSVALLTLRLFDGAGLQTSHFSFALPGALTGRELAIATSPAEDAVLVGWTAVGAPPALNTTGLVRFDCVGADGP